jgi:hypothetical protein
MVFSHGLVDVFLFMFGISFMSEVFDMTQPVELSEEGQRALAALQKAANNALQRKARLGQFAVIWRDGKPIMTNSEADREERASLLADRAFNVRMLAQLPENAQLTRMSVAARIQHIDALLAHLPDSDTQQTN